MTIANILDYLVKNENSINANVIKGMLIGLMESDNLDTSDADATAADIAEGKTAYVNGEKITGTATIS